jgi:hypothetical protein
MDTEMKDINRQIKHADEHSFFVASMDVYHPQYRQQKAHLSILEERIQHAIAAYYKKKTVDEACAAIPASQPDFRERRKQFEERARAYRSQQKQTLAAAKAAAEEEAEYVFVQEPDVEEDWVLLV